MVICHRILKNFYNLKERERTNGGRSSRLKGSSVVEEAKRKLREKVEERKRQATKKKRSALKERNERRRRSRRSFEKLMYS